MLKLSGFIYIRTLMLSTVIGIFIRLFSFNYTCISLQGFILEIFSLTRSFDKGGDITPGGQRQIDNKLMN